MDLKTARPRRRIGNGKSSEDVEREELICHVRRYEALFRRHGLQFEASDQDNTGDENLALDSHPVARANVFIDQMLTRQ